MEGFYKLKYVHNTISFAQIAKCLFADHQYQYYDFVVIRLETIRYVVKVIEGTTDLNLASALMISS